MDKYRKNMIARMEACLISRGVPQDRAHLIAAEHTVGQTEAVPDVPGNPTQRTRRVWGFRETATWADVPLAGEYTEYDTDGVEALSVRIDSTVRL